MKITKNTLKRLIKEEMDIETPEDDMSEPTAQGHHYMVDYEEVVSYVYSVCGMGGDCGDTSFQEFKHELEGEIPGYRGGVGPCSKIRRHRGVRKRLKAILRCANLVERAIENVEEY